MPSTTIVVTALALVFPALVVQRVLELRCRLRAVPHDMDGDFILVDPVMVLQLPNLRWICRSMQWNWKTKHSRELNPTGNAKSANSI